MIALIENTEGIHQDVARIGELKLCGKIEKAGCVFLGTKEVER